MPGTVRLIALGRFTDDARYTNLHVDIDIDIIGLSPVTRYTVSVQPILGPSLQRVDTTVTITVQTLPPGQPITFVSIGVTSVRLYAVAPTL